MRASWRILWRSGVLSDSQIESRWGLEVLQEFMRELAQARALSESQHFLEDELRQSQMEANEGSELDDTTAHREAGGSGIEAKDKTNGGAAENGVVDRVQEEGTEGAATAVLEQHEGFVTGRVEEEDSQGANVAAPGQHEDSYIPPGQSDLVDDSVGLETSGGEVATVIERDDDEHLDVEPALDDSLPLLLPRCDRTNVAAGLDSLGSQLRALRHD